jgi:hypothetical protein
MGYFTQCQQQMWKRKMNELERKVTKSEKSVNRPMLQLSVAKEK